MSFYLKLGILLGCTLLPWTKAWGAIPYPPYETYQANAYERAATNCMAQMGMEQRCAALLEQALQFAPERSDLRLQLGHLYLALGEYARAQSLFAALLRKDPENTAALLGLSTVYVRTGELHLARQKLQAFEAMGGKHPQALYLHAEILVRTGNDKEALAALKKAIDEGFNGQEAVRTASYWKDIRKDPTIRAWLDTSPEE